jgi:predicted GH43/DUF377 family glycosyl hydrolase
MRWDWGHLRGGAPPVRRGGEYYHFFHGALDAAGGRTYTLGAYTFEAAPPFRVTRFAPLPLLLPTEGGGNVPRVVFPCGAVDAGSHWLVSYGVNDRWARVARFTSQEVEKALKEVV